MKNIFKILILSTIFASCDVADGSMDIARAERLTLEQRQKELEERYLKQQKELNDSFNAKATKLLDSLRSIKKGYFLSNTTGLPPGKILRFKPESLEDAKLHAPPNGTYTGPYMCVVVSPNGVQTINYLSYNNWMILEVGDEIKK